MLVRSSEATRRTTFSQDHLAQGQDSRQRRGKGPVAAIQVRALEAKAMIDVYLKHSACTVVVALRQPT
jgi:hypothetical protein